MMFRRSTFHLFFFITIFSLSIARAGALFSLGGAYLQTNSSLSDQSLITNYAFDVAAYAPLSRGDRLLYLGIEYMETNVNHYLDSTTKANLSSSDVMLSLKYAFGPKELFAFTAGFSPYTKATYKVTSLNKDTWYGTSYMTKFSVQPDLGLTQIKFKVAASILYYHSAYTEKINSSSENSSSGSLQTFNKNFTAPAIEFIYKF